MGKQRDYTKYSNNQHNKREPEEIKTPTVEAVEEAVTETVEEVATPAEPKQGVVTDCVKLNVRKEARPNAEVVCIIDASTTLMISEEESTEEFYKVYTAAGLEGYCMKKFIAIMP